MRDFKKVAIVTGASRGIGRATAIKFASSGYYVALAGRSENELDALKKELEDSYSVQALVCVGDAVAPAYGETMVATVVDQWGRVDALINNAAWRTITPMDEMDLADWDKTIRICLTAPAFLAKFVADVMAKQTHGGVIVNISSIMADRAAGYSPAYIACKGALESLTYELAALYGPRNIRVVCVNPGNITTSMSTDYKNAASQNLSDKIANEMHLHTPLGRSGSAEELANVIHWLASEQASFITGTTVVADGGFSHNFNSYPIKKLQFPHSF